MTLIAYWVIGLPLGYFFATYTDWAAKGYWIGLILGLAFGASFLLVRLFQVQRKYITEKKSLNIAIFLQVIERIHKFTSVQEINVLYCFISKNVDNIRSFPHLMNHETMNFNIRRYERMMTNNINTLFDIFTNISFSI